eukprot:COSAG01_NODE_24038_length_793_cov_0.966859_1_plen_56_part_01
MLAVGQAAGLAAALAVAVHWSAVAGCRCAAVNYYPVGEDQMDAAPQFRRFASHCDS